MSERQGGLGPHRPTGIIHDEAVEHAAIVPAGLSIEEATAKIIDAAGKGRLALLVTDAAGNVVVGLQATGGLTELRHRPADNLWTFAGAFGGTPLVLEGSVALRNALGTEADQTPDDFEEASDRVRHGWDIPRELPQRRPGDALERARNPLGLPPIPQPEGEPQPAFVCPECGARSWHPEDGRQGYCARCHAFTGHRAVVPLPELEPGYAPMPQRSHWQHERVGQPGAPDAMPPESGGEDVDFGPPVWELPGHMPQPEPPPDHPFEDDGRTRRCARPGCGLWRSVHPGVTPEEEPSWGPV